MSKKKPAPDVMTVEVTELDIKRGRPQIPEMCPIARAITRAGYRHVFVGPDDCMVNDGIYRLPKRAGKFVIDFDYDKDNAKLKPFKFTMRKKH